MKPALRLRGRHWIALALAAFLVVALVVVRRQSTALEAARDLRELEQVRGALEVQRASLIGSLQHARSRGVMVPLARRRHGLRLPQDSEITILQGPPPR